MEQHFPQSLLDDTPEGDIISFLLFAPPRTFSARELGERLEMRPNRLMDALTRLVDGGQLATCTRRAIQYYYLNPKHKFYPQIHERLLRRGQKYEDELFVAIRKMGAKGAYLSGLFVGKPELPADILLIGKFEDKKLRNFVEACELMLGQEVNYCVMDEEEFKFRRNTFDRFIKDIFDYPYIEVIPVKLSKHPLLAK
jgi:hypothetical protein